MSPGPLTYEVPHPPRWSRFLLGFGIHGVCVLLLAITNPQVFTARTPLVAAKDHHVTLTGPASLTAPEPPHLVTTPAQLRQIELPKAATPLTEKPVPIARKPISPAPEAPRLSASLATSLPPEPAPEKRIKIDVLSRASSESATLPPSPRQVQTGAFGDPNSVPAPKTAPLPVTVARLGRFDLPSGEGRGNGRAGFQGASGTVRSAGFMDATSYPHSVAQVTRNVQTGGFEIVVPQATSPSARQVQEEPVLQPVAIIYKPRPAYTPEARQQRVEGEVLLEVVFTASGSLHVNRVVKGLGYGRDETAMAAAQRIQFHPAERDGKPYDCAALVHVVFELPN